MRVVVTGGAGFIGSHLCDRLIEADHEVMAIDNLVTGDAENLAHLAGHDRFQYIRHDVSNFIFVSGKVDAIWHLASPASPNPLSPYGYPQLPIQTLKVGALGTHNALGLARANEAVFMLASTSEVYRRPEAFLKRDARLPVQNFLCAADIRPSLLGIGPISLIGQILDSGFAARESQHEIRQLLNRHLDRIPKIDRVVGFNFHEAEQPLNEIVNVAEAPCLLTVPVIVKEVGWGISASVATRLVETGVAVIDVAGAGGTSWSQVEMHRAAEEKQAELASKFIDWGIPTAEAVRQVRAALPNIPIIASGGLRGGLDLAKSIALGAQLGGMAGPFLRAAAESSQAVTDLIDRTLQELRVCMFATGTRDLNALPSAKLLSQP